MIRLATGAMFLVILAATASAVPAADAATEDVQVQDFQFSPASVTVTVGDTVRWTWTGSAPHDVQADDGSFDSGAPVTSGEFSRVFDAPGTYGYFCSFHGANVMSGVVNVQEASTATPTPTSAAATPTRTRTSVPSATAEATTTVATATAAAPTSTPITVADPGEVMPVSAPVESGAAVPAVALPSTGSGPAPARNASPAASILLALTAAAMLAAAGSVARRLRETRG